MLLSDIYVFTSECDQTIKTLSLRIWDQGRIQKFQKGVHKITVFPLWPLFEIL